MPRTVDLVRDWGLGGDLTYFKELLGTPPARPEASLPELAALLATLLKRRLLVRGSRVTFRGDQVEFHWLGCRFVASARQLAQEGARCQPCPLAEVGLDFFLRNGWNAKLVHHRWDVEDICTMVITAKRAPKGEGGEQ